MRTILTCLLLALALMAHAQRACVSSDYLQQFLEEPSSRAAIRAAEQHIQNHLAARQNGDENRQTIRIPVVVHILYQQSAQNISDAQVRSQLEVLNQDFRRLNRDTLHTPERFRALAGSLPFEFVLASVDPQGRATTGIVRKQTSVAYFTADDRIKFSSQGGNDAWDARYYLNIWVGNMRGVLGYASVPGSPLNRDGVVVALSAFGTVNVSAPYEGGRTAVHEVGHWLGLKHIWGDTYCGDDSVDDTPKQGNFTAGCPTGFRSSCNNGASGDMFMNFMDFTNDACMNLFTKGQADRMLAAFATGGARNSLLSSRALGQPWNHEPVIAPLPASDVQVFPNPVHTALQVKAGPDWSGTTLRLINAQGVTVKRILLTTVTAPADLSGLPAGLYFIEGEKGGIRVRQKLIKL